jgi:hypothetical protein
MKEQNLKTIYLVAVKSPSGAKIFEFKTIENRQAFINSLSKNVRYAISKMEVTK